MKEKLAYKKSARSDKYQYLICEKPMILWESMIPIYSENRTEEQQVLIDNAMHMFFSITIPELTDTQFKILELFSQPGKTQQEIANELKQNQSSIVKTFLGSKKQGGIRAKMYNALLSSDLFRLTIKNLIDNDIICPLTQLLLTHLHIDGFFKWLETPLHHTYKIETYIVDTIESRLLNINPDYIQIASWAKELNITIRLTKQIIEDQKNNLENLLLSEHQLKEII